MHVCIMHAYKRTSSLHTDSKQASQPASQQASKQPDINSRIHACILSVHDGYAHMHGQRESERYMLTYYPVLICINVCVYLQILYNMFGSM